MGKVIDALRALQSIIENSEPAPYAVFVRPDDFEDISVNLENLPIVIISEIVAQENEVQPQSWGLGASVLWNIGIDVLVWQGEISDDTQAMQAEPLHRDWAENILKIIFDKQNSKLNGTVSGFGDEGATYEIGHLAIGTNIYWGVHFVVPTKHNLRG